MPIDRRLKPRPHSDRRNAPRLENGLLPLSEVYERFAVADGYPDVRGWMATVARGTVVGTVRDLVIDPRTLVARYAVVELGPQGTDESAGRKVIVPMAQAVLRAGTDELHWPRLSYLDFIDLPEYTRGELALDHEVGLLRRIGVHAVAEMTDEELTGRHHELEQPIARAVEPDVAAARGDVVRRELPDHPAGAPE